MPAVMKASPAAPAAVEGGVAVEVGFERHREGAVGAVDRSRDCEDLLLAQHAPETARDLARVAVEEVEEDAAAGCRSGRSSRRPRAAFARAWDRSRRGIDAARSGT